VESNAGPILVLFDIDGTLLSSGGAGVRGMTRAFEEVHGVPAAFEGVPIAGRTDRAILADAFVRAGVPASDEHASRFRAAYFRHLADELAVAEVRVMPGVDLVLDALDLDERFTLALLTGNYAEGAKLKLESAGVWSRFAFGAYGDEFVNRRDLVPLALTRAAEAGLSPESVIVIGDTPLDVDCALAHGALAVAVATGSYGVDALRASGADLVVETLEGLAPAAHTLAALCRRRQA
jgi:phosphoglycolate phosphatase-like HAD superfamily hydrolase